MTVSHLLNHESGIGSFDVGVYEDAVLQNFTERFRAVHSPLEDLQFVANFTQPDFCSTGNCTWIFKPGGGCSYSSTNFVLTGLVLLAHSTPPHDTWQTIDLRAMLGIEPGQYPHTHFPAVGALNTVGLNTVGECDKYGHRAANGTRAKVDVFRQVGTSWC